MKHLKHAAVAALAVAALLLAPAAVRADDTELAKQMEIIDGSMKKLRRTLKAADQNAESMKLIEEMKKASIASKALIPVMAKDVPEAERAKFVAAYQAAMDVFIAEVDKLAAAVKENKSEAAQEIYTKLKEMEDTGHKQFTKE